MSNLNIIKSKQKIRPNLGQISPKTKDTYSKTQESASTSAIPTPKQKAIQQAKAKAQQKAEIKTKENYIKNHSKNSELDGVENGLLEIRVAQQLCIVLKGDKMGPFLQAAEKVVVGKAVNQRKEQRIRRHDQQDHNGRGQHSQTKPFGLGICGAEFGIYVSFHDSGLTFQKRYGS